MKVDVCIPVYKPGDEFYKLCQRLAKQSVRINALRITNTCEKFWKDDYVEAVKASGIDVFVTHISHEQYDHGRIRDIMARESDADYVLFMTQDAIPRDKYLIERLLDAFEDKSIVSAYARQLPKKGCAALERQSRMFNYPKTSKVKSAEDIKELGIKTFFCSNVCAMYRRKTYLSLGGFPVKTIFNEDMIFASRVIRNGYSIKYCADALVFHSHNYTLPQYFRRSFDMAVSQAMYENVFKGLSSEKEGMKLVRAVSGRLIRKGDIAGEALFVVQCAAKYSGYFLGKNYKKLKPETVVKLSDNKFFWNNV